MKEPRFSFVEGVAPSSLRKTVVAAFGALYVIIKDKDNIRGRTITWT